MARYRTFRLGLLAGLLSLLAAAVPATAARYALLVGIRDYGVKGWNLKAPGNDLALMGDVCRRWGISGKAVTELRDRGATPAALYAAIGALARQARRGDQVLFYFSGHAIEIMDRDLDEKLPRDANDEALVLAPTRPGGPVSLVLDDWLNWAFAPLRQSGVQLVAVLDCCYSYDGMRAPVPGLELGPEKTLRGRQVQGKVSLAPQPPRKAVPGSPLVVSAAGQNWSTREINWPLGRARVPISPLTLSVWALAPGAGGWEKLVAAAQAKHKRLGLPWQPALSGPAASWPPLTAGATAHLTLVGKDGQKVLVQTADLQRLLP